MSVSALMELLLVPGLLPAALLTLGVLLVNGWTDAPNAIATAVASGALPFSAAAALAAVSPEARRELLLFYEEEDGSPMAARWGGF